MANIYGYARVSTKEQNLDRQIAQLQEIVKDNRNIITDKESGANFDRKGYNLLVGSENNTPLLREGDLLVVSSLDRFGRNYAEIKKQWEYITKTIKADIKVLDMPLLDTSITGDTLDRKFICDLVLQILSYTAEKERQFILKRQKEGIAIAKSQGKHLGRPKIEYPENWENIYTQWKNGTITAVKAMDILGLKRCTFYKLVADYQK